MHCVAHPQSAPFRRVFCCTEGHPCGGGCISPVRFLLSRPAHAAPRTGAQRRGGGPSCHASSPDRRQAPCRPAHAGGWVARPRVDRAASWIFIVSHCVLMLTMMMRRPDSEDTTVCTSCERAGGGAASTCSTDSLDGTVYGPLGGGGTHTLCQQLCHGGCVRRRGWLRPALGTHSTAAFRRRVWPVAQPRGARAAVGRLVPGTDARPIALFALCLGRCFCVCSLLSSPFLPPSLPRQPGTLLH